MLLRLQFLGRDAAGSNDHVQMANDYQIQRLKPALVVTACRLHNISCPRKAGKMPLLQHQTWIFCCLPHINRSLYSYQKYYYYFSVSLVIIMQQKLFFTKPYNLVLAWWRPDVLTGSSGSSGPSEALWLLVFFIFAELQTIRCAFAEVRARSRPMSLVHSRMPNIWGRLLPMLLSDGQPESIYLLLIIRQITSWIKLV